MPESDWNRPVQCSGRRGGMKIPHKPNRMDEVKAVRRVVWDPGANYSRGPDSPLLILGVVVMVDSFAYRL
jgi:hypothetical protein